MDVETLIIVVSRLYLRSTRGAQIGADSRVSALKLSSKDV